MKTTSSLKVGAVIISMLMILQTFHAKTQQLKNTMNHLVTPRCSMQSSLVREQNSAEFPGSRRSTQERLLSIQQQRAAKSFVQQASMYMFAAALTWTFLITSFFKDNSYIGTLKLCTQPMQGFFNLCIFMYHKVHSLRRSDRNLGIYKAILMIVFVHNTTATASKPVKLDDKENSARSSFLDRDKHRMPLTNLREEADEGLLRNNRVWRLGGLHERNQDDLSHENASSVLDLAHVRSSALSTGKGSCGNVSTANGRLWLPSCIEDSRALRIH